MSTPASERLLVLDIDETLVFGTEVALDRPADFQVGPYLVYSRPHLTRFLEAISPWYALAIWSSASLGYVSQIAQHIRPSGVHWRFVWGRDRCVQRMHPERWDTVFLKDVKKVKRLGYDVRRVLMVDDSPVKLSRNYGNAIYVRPFEGSLADDELPRLATYLESLRHSGDYRTIEKRYWRVKPAGTPST